jgi:hypothetical protein
MSDKKPTHIQATKARIEAEIARVESDLIRAARERQQKIGIEADKKLLMILEKNGLLPVPGIQGDGLGMPASPQMVSAIKLGMQRAGLLIEKHEVVDMKRPLREASEAELIAELDGRDVDAK